MFKVVLKCYIANIPEDDVEIGIRTKKEARKIARRLQKGMFKHPVYGYGMVHKVRRDMESVYRETYKLPEFYMINPVVIDPEKEKLIEEIINDDSLSKYEKLVKKLEVRLGTDKITVSVTPCSIIVDRTDKLECIVNMGNFYNAPYLTQGSNEITQITDKDLEDFNILEPLIAL